MTPKSSRIDDLLDDAALQNPLVLPVAGTNAGGPSHRPRHRGAAATMHAARNGTSSEIARDGIAGSTTRIVEEDYEDDERVDDADELCLHWGQPDWISTGDPEIDLALGGGIRTGVITEIAGER